MTTSESTERPSEALFARLATDDPARLVVMLTSGELSPGLLTYAAEIAGQQLPSAMVVPALLTLLRHEKAVVREGAIYGLSGHEDLRIESEIHRIAMTDGSPAVRSVAVGALCAIKGRVEDADSVPPGYWEALGKAIDACPELPDEPDEIEVEPFI